MSRGLGLLARFGFAGAVWVCWRGAALLAPFAVACLRALGTCFRVGLLARRYARQQSLSLLLQRK
jgi:hypothetical protein